MLYILTGNYWNIFLYVDDKIKEIITIMANYR